MKNLYYGFLLSVCLILNVIAGQQSHVDTGFIDVPDGKLYYEMTGQGDETIVLFMMAWYTASLG